MKKILKYIKFILKYILRNVYINRLVCLFIPSKKLRKKFHSKIVRIQRRKIEYNYNKIIMKLKEKDKIKVAFFVVHDSVWQYDDVYKLMLKNDEFDPIIIIVPYNIYGKENMITDMDKAYKYFMDNKYSVVKTYNKKSNKYLDVYKEINPDMIFFTNPHKLTENQYYIDYWYDKVLTCYAPYSLEISNLYQLQFNQKFHNIIWKYYNITEIHKDLSIEYAQNKGKNVVITGYPECDVLLDKKYSPKNIWKKQSKEKKKIIWTPHQSIEDNEKELGFSCFFKYHQVMLDVAKKYEDKIQIAFKPHPLLKIKLYNHSNWGRNKTNLYYEKWEKMSNTQVETSQYIDLFLTSDAIINSSVSFTAEYLYTGKPALFNVKDSKIQSKFNPLGKIAFEKWYKSYKKEDIVKFIEEIILGKSDILKESRNKFIKEYLIPPNCKTASENIIDDLKKEIRG